MSNKFLFITILLGSFLISNLFWFGPIDQDFYSFYYIGQGVSEGHRMYADFAENKGPILYIFFALLYFVFKGNYIWALIFGATIIDALSLFVIFKILERNFKFVWSKNKALNILFIIFCLTLYKSFSMGYNMGGLYSENLGMLLLVLGYWALGSKRYISSGIFFSLSILTRLSFLAFTPLFLVEFIFSKKDRKKILRFIIGGLIPLILSFIYFHATNDLKDFFYSSVTQNFGLLKLNSNLPLSILLVSLSQTRIFLTLTISSIIVVIIVLSKKQLKEKAILSALFIGSVASSFAGGYGNIFYYHHFFQFNFLAIATLSLIATLRNTRTFFIPILSILAFFIFLNYYFFINSSFKNFQAVKVSHPVISEISSKKYLIVTPHYPMYYFIYDKKAPDRYFQYFSLSKYFSKDTEKNIARHLRLMDKKTSQTAFMFVNRGSSDRKIIEEYKNNFEKEFNLKKINTYHDLDATIEIYESSGK